MPLRYVGKGIQNRLRGFESVALLKIEKASHEINHSFLTKNEFSVFQSRVTTRNVGERNFHIFYQLLSGADIQFLSTFHLYNLMIFRKLSQNSISESLKLQRNTEKYELLKHGSPTENDKENFVFTKVYSSNSKNLLPLQIDPVWKY